MTADTHRFRIGAFDCTAINDGYFDYPQPAKVLFANAPDEELAPVLRSHGIDPATWEAYASPYPSLLIETDGHRLLVDMGAGRLGPKTGNLWANLQTANVSLETIDTVFITHAHPDHIGGALNEAGQPILPNARYLIGRREWEFWAAQPDLMNLKIPDHLREAIIACAGTTLPALDAHVELVEPGDEILPGIQAIAAPGHTSGQMALSVSSGEERLLALTDVFLHPIHIEHPQWVAPFDYDPDLTVATRRILYARAVAEDALITAGHLPWPCLGRIQQEGDGWRWAPVVG